MTQFHTDEFRQSRDVRIQVKRSTCGRAKWAARLALLPFIPLMPVLVLLIGWRALGAIRNDASLTGRGRARFAVLMGLLFTGAQGFLGWQGWRYVEAARSGPQPILARGMSGDVDAFLAEFDGSVEPFDPEFASVFLEVVNERYGTCGRTSLELPSRWYFSWRPFQPFEYAAQFEQAIVPVTAQFVMKPEYTTWKWQPRMRYLVIHDAQRGDLRFPPDASSMQALAAHAGGEY